MHTYTKIYICYYTSTLVLFMAQWLESCLHHLHPW